MNNNLFEKLEVKKIIAFQIFFNCQIYILYVNIPSSLLFLLQNIFF